MKNKPNPKTATPATPADPVVEAKRMLAKHEQAVDAACKAEIDASLAKYSRRLVIIPNPNVDPREVAEGIYVRPRVIALAPKE